jgi:hypothetical protein
MAIVSCSECAGKVSDAAAACPHCGAPVTPVIKDAGSTPKKSGSVWKWIFGVPVGLFLLMMIIGSINSDPEKNNARHAYGTCMDSLKDNDRARAGSGAFIAGACERMRNDYIKKYGTTP